MSDQFDRRSFITKLALAAGISPVVATARLFGQAPSPPTNVRIVPLGTAGQLSITALSAGPITQGMTFLDGQVANAVQVGAVATQTNVLSRYGSGSVKHAAVSWVIPSAGSYAISSSADPGGSLTPTNPSASVAFVIGGTTYTATLPAFDSSKTRFNGAICRECRYITTPMNGATPHNFLTVIFDVRSYVGGKHRVDIQVGSTKDIAGTNTVTYDLTITVAGSAVYTRSSMEHGSFMRWRKLAFVNLTEGKISDDTSALQALKVVPTYLNSVISPSYTFTDNIGGRTNGDRGFDLLRTGLVQPNFGNTGGREDIGLFPRWAAAYLAHKTANTKECMLRHGDLSGSWSTAITTGSSGNPEDLINLDNVPTWSTVAYGGATLPANNNAGVGMSWDGQNPDSAHQPNLNFLPWLLTADRWYADQLAFWANWNMLHQPSNFANNCRNGSMGLMINDQQRGWAWGVRAIGQAGKWLPDAHPFKAYFAQKAQNNLNWCDAYDPKWYVGGLNGALHPLGFWGQPAVDQNSIWNQGWSLDAAKIADLQAAGYADLQQMIMFAPWQYDFMCTVIAHLHHLGYTGGLGALDMMLTVIHNLFSHDPDVPRAHATMFFPPCAYNTSTGTVLLKTWHDLHHLSALWRGDLQDGSSSGCPAFTDAYGVMARAALALGTSRGLDNAGHLAFLMAYVDPFGGATMVDSVNNQPEWGFTEGYLTL
jgi:hypothetical protein